MGGQQLLMHSLMNSFVQTYLSNDGDTTMPSGDPHRQSANEKKQRSFPSNLGIEANRLLELYKELTVCTQNQFVRVKEAATAKKLCEVFELPANIYQEWLKARKDQEQALSEGESPRPSCSRRHHPGQRCSPSRFAPKAQPPAQGGKRSRPPAVASSTEEPTVTTTLCKAAATTSASNSDSMQCCGFAPGCISSNGQIAAMPRKDESIDTQQGGSAPQCAGSGGCSNEAIEECSRLPLVRTDSTSGRALQLAPPQSAEPAGEQGQAPRVFLVVGAKRMRLQLTPAQLRACQKL